MTNLNKYNELISVIYLYLLLEHLKQKSMEEWIFFYKKWTYRHTFSKYLYNKEIFNIISRLKFYKIYSELIFMAFWNRKLISEQLEELDKEIEFISNRITIVNSETGKIHKKLSTYTTVSKNDGAKILY